MCRICTRGAVHAARHLQIWPHSNHHDGHHSARKADVARERPDCKLFAAFLRVGRGCRCRTGREMEHRAVERLATQTPPHGAERRWAECGNGHHAAALGTSARCDGGIARATDGRSTIHADRRCAATHAGSESQPPVPSHARHTGLNEPYRYYGGIDTHRTLER